MTFTLTKGKIHNRHVFRGVSGDAWESIKPLWFTRGRIGFFSRTRKEWIVKGGAYVLVREHGVVLFGRIFSTSTETTVFAPRKPG